MLGPHGGGAALRVRMRILLLLLAMIAPALAQAASQVRSPTTCASFDTSQRRHIVSGFGSAAATR